MLGWIIVIIIWSFVVALITTIGTLYVRELIVHRRKPTEGHMVAFKATVEELIQQELPHIIEFLALEKAPHIKVVWGTRVNCDAYCVGNTVYMPIDRLFHLSYEEIVFNLAHEVTHTCKDNDKQWVRDIFRDYSERYSEYHANTHAKAYLTHRGYQYGYDVQVNYRWK